MKIITLFFFDVPEKSDHSFGSNSYFPPLHKVGPPVFISCARRPQRDESSRQA